MKQMVSSQKDPIPGVLVSSPNVEGKRDIVSRGGGRNGGQNARETLVTETTKTQWG